MIETIDFWAWWPFRERLIFLFWLMLALALLGLRCTSGGELEWSGICRADRNRYPGLYWAISDSSPGGTTLDSRLYLVDEKGEIVKSLAVLTTGGGILPNRDWEDICRGPRNFLYILDGISNDATQNAIYCIKEPIQPAESACVVGVNEFRESSGDIEAIFYGEWGVYAIPKKVFDAPLGCLAFLVSSDVALTGGTSPISMVYPPVLLPWDFPICTAADTIEEAYLSEDVKSKFLSQYTHLLLLHGYATTYVVDYPGFFKQYKVHNSFDWRTEGACFTHDGVGIVIQRERVKELEIINWRNAE